ncbi:unnamed protein product [Symbiodinium sp. CCMP2592]|nr:unnamed protein product [Symbiodinium sp. CCMP2592]
MDTQLVLPGQVRLAPESAPRAAETSSRERQERMSGMRLPIPRISEESLQERLRSLEIECQQLRDSNSRLELENSRLKLQVSSSQATSEQPGSTSRLKGSISVAETHHQVLRTRMRAMLEEQKLLVDELQREIAEEMNQLQVRPIKPDNQPIGINSCSSRSGFGEWPSAHTAPRDLKDLREAAAPEEDPLGSWPTRSQPWPSSRVSESALPTRASNNGSYLQSVPDELNAPCEVAPPPEVDSPVPARKPAVAMPTSRTVDRGGSRPFDAHSAPDELRLPWEVAAPPEEGPPSAASFASSARLQRGGAAMPEEPNAPSEAASEDDAPRSLDSQKRACSVCQACLTNP